MHAHGPTSLTDQELLSVLLRNGEIGEPVNELAGRLLREAGGLAELLHHHGSAGTNTNRRGSIRPELAVVLELAKRATAQQLGARDVFGSPDAVKNYLQLHLARRPHEVFVVLFLDAQNRLICMEEMFRGTLTQTSVYPREVVLAALRFNAGAVILAHNHPSGTVQPSRADETLTQTIKASLELVDVRVLDHVIVAPGAALSMAERGLL
jgi:DNA repair protein RadC